MADLSDAEIDQLVKMGAITPLVGDVMKAHNAKLAEANVNTAPGVAVTGAVEAAKPGVESAPVRQWQIEQIAEQQKQAQRNKMLAAMVLAKGNPQINARPEAEPKTALAFAPNIATPPSEYVTRANTPAVGSPAGSYMSPATVYGAQKNGGVIPADAEGVPAYGPGGIAPGGPTTTEKQFAKAVDPSLVDGLKAVGAITPETAEKMHALNEEEKKKKS